MHIMTHPIAQAQFDATAVGTLITKKSSYMDLLQKEISTFSFPKTGNRAGQGQIPVPEAKSLVTPGIARRTLLTEDTGVIREHRGEQTLCIDRNKVDVGDVDSVTAIVYTIEAYLEDPEVSDSEQKELEGTSYTHVLVTTIGGKGPERPPVGPSTFMKNVAGANRAYVSVDIDIVEAAKVALEKSKDDPAFLPIEKTSAWEFCKWAGNQDIDEDIRVEAQNVLAYWSIWATVG